MTSYMHACTQIMHGLAMAMQIKTSLVSINHTSSSSQTPGRPPPHTYGNFYTTTTHNIYYAPLKSTLQGQQ